MKLNSKHIQAGMWIIVLLATFYWTGETMMWIIKNNVPDIPTAFFVIPPLMFVALFGMMQNLSDFGPHKDLNPTKVPGI